MRRLSTALRSISKGVSGTPQTPSNGEYQRKGLESQQKSAATGKTSNNLNDQSVEIQKKDKTRISRMSVHGTSGKQPVQASQASQKSRVANETPFVQSQNLVKSQSQSQQGRPSIDKNSRKSETRVGSINEQKRGRLTRASLLIPIFNSKEKRGFNSSLTNLQMQQQLKGTNSQTILQGTDSKNKYISHATPESKGDCDYCKIYKSRINELKEDNGDLRVSLQLNKESLKAALLAAATQQQVASQNESPPKNELQNNLIQTISILSAQNKQLEDKIEDLKRQLELPITSPFKLPSNNISVQTVTEIKNSLQKQKTNSFSILPPVKVSTEIQTESQMETLLKISIRLLQQYQRFTAEMGRDYDLPESLNDEITDLSQRVQEIIQSFTNTESLADIPCSDLNSSNWSACLSQYAYKTFACKVPILDLVDLPQQGSDEYDYCLSGDGSGDQKQARSLIGDVRYHNHHSTIPERSPTKKLESTAKKYNLNSSDLFKDNFDLLGGDDSDMLFELRENAQSLCGNLYSPPANNSLKKGQKENLQILDISDDSNGLKSEDEDPAAMMAALCNEDGLFTTFSDSGTKEGHEISDILQNTHSDILQNTQ